MKLVTQKIINIYFAITKTCNLRCSYCYLLHQFRTEKIDEDKILKSLYDLIQKFERENYQFGSFCFHGAEPAMMSAESLADAVVMLNGHWKKNNDTIHQTAIQSNGTLFTDDYLDIIELKLNSNKMLKLGFSIDPPREIHNKFRNNSYKLVYDNYLNSIDRGFPVGVLSVVTSETLNNLDGFRYWMINELERKKGNNNPYKIKIKFASGEYSLNNKQFVEFAVFLSDNSLLHLCQIFTPGYCIQSGNECFWLELDTDGSCYSCNKSYHENGIFADWKKESYENIINRRKQLYLNLCRNPECDSCSYEIICNSGCPIDRQPAGIDKGKAHECSLIKTAMIELDKRNINFVEFLNGNI